MAPGTWCTEDMHETWDEFVRNELVVVEAPAVLVCEDLAVPAGVARTSRS